MPNNDGISQCLLFIQDNFTMLKKMNTIFRIWIHIILKSNEIFLTPIPSTKFN